MLFSKSRTKLFGWFDTEFDGVWGAEEHEFASRAYHSGMRLRYSEELKVTHLWHTHISRDNYPRNRKMWIDKVAQHPTDFNRVTPYKPAVGVMVITMLRPDLIDQCLQAIFRNRVPLKVRLIINGDDSEETNQKADAWGGRWAVDVAKHGRKWPAVVRNETMRWAKQHNYKYLVFLDDDMLVANDGITTLINEAEHHPEYYALSGSFKSARGIPERMLGGPMRDGNFYNYPWRGATVESDWVGGGFTIHRLDPLILYDEQYQTGYNDFDWSMIVKSKGLRLGVTGLATAHHFFKQTAKGLVPYKNPPEYHGIRYDLNRHAQMRKIFKSKWGYEIQQGGLWKT